MTTTTPGLTTNHEKTRAVSVHDPARVIVFQSRRMRRIQEEVSGGFDAQGGTQLLSALEGLFNTVGQFADTDVHGNQWPLNAVPDVRDETVARFVASRYRATFRSLRPLLEDEIVAVPHSGGEDVGTLVSPSPVLTKDELDRQSQAFSLRLIEEWIRNAGSVRLLRVGLDLFPNASILESVLGILRPTLSTTHRDRGRRAVAEYCLSEIYRAAATETGLVSDSEQLPHGVDIDQYHDVLRVFAIELMNERWNRLPWFLRQQILLFLATSSPVGIDTELAGSSRETSRYAELIEFLQGQPDGDTSSWVTKAILARQSFLDAAETERLVVPQLTERRLSRIADLCPSLAEELLLNNERVRKLATPTVLTRLSLPFRSRNVAERDSDTPVINEARRWDCRLRDEINLLRFASQWLQLHEDGQTISAPANVWITFSQDETDFHVAVRTRTPRNSLFSAPEWFFQDDKWRFQLGLMMRFIIAGRSDPTQPVGHPTWRQGESCYRPPPWHWSVRRNALFNARDGLGSDWLPISSWLESFLSTLLHWPGMLEPKKPFQHLTPKKALRLCQKRIKELGVLRGEATGLLMLPVRPRSEWRRDRSADKPLRVCIAQMAVPEFQQGRPGPSFNVQDPEFNRAATRRQFRRHLTAMLAGVDQMLRVRATHKENVGLDFLILPELSVHPSDVRARLLPFVRKHRCWVFTGLTYHRCHRNGPLVNSGLWIVPESTPATGVMYKFYEQGKMHLSPEEAAALGGSVQGYRPCQWLMHWKWSTNRVNRPLKLTGSICYDATDLALASDLRTRSDIYVVPALNRDVGTFDRMTEALHYHMYQMIVLANHAHFGGSNAYLPYREQFQKQLFHLHGQDEGILAFFDIVDPGALISRGSSQSVTSTARIWKTPPAGWHPW